MMITFARGESGIEDGLSVAISHSLIREGEGQPAPTREEWAGFVDRLEADYRAGRIHPVQGARRLGERFGIARNAPVDGPRWYAAQRMVDRARRAQAAQVEYLQRFARDFGVPIEHASAEFHVAFQAATDDSSLRPSPAFRTAWENNPDNTDLFPGHRSQYAYEQMEISRAARQLQQQAAPGIIRTPMRSNAIAETGYDPNASRCEVVMRSNPDRIYHYYLTQDEYDAFVGSDAPGRFFHEHIRGRRDYQFQDEAQAGQVARSCATCGQFAELNGHVCPVTGSEEDLNRDVRLAVERARRNAAGLPPTEPAREPTRLAFRRTMRYPVEVDGTSVDMRIPGVTVITQAARRDDRVLVPVNAVDWRDGAASVRGNVQVEYNGYGRGYSVTAVNAPGDSGQDNLRCRCDRYRANYDCEHVRATVNRVHDLVNGLNRPTPEVAQAAVATAAADLQQQYDASIAATTTTQRNWTPIQTSLVDNPEIFQEMYDKAKEERKAYLEAKAARQIEEIEAAREGRTLAPANIPSPIPFYETDPFLGLGSRASGRGFGIEPEFSFPPGTSASEAERRREKIGLELFEAGLTSEPQQRQYGATHGQYRENHDGGYSYEEDPSTGDYGGYGNGPVQGGEITTPVAFADDPKTWESQRKIKEILTRNGAIASTKSGIHVHIGTGDYDHRVENYSRFMQIYSEYTDLLYRMNTNTETGRHRRGNYSQPNSVPSSPYTTIGDVVGSDRVTGHDHAINFQSVSGDNSDHVEIRIGDSNWDKDSDIDLAAMQARVGMAYLMAEGATRNGPTNPSENQTNRGDHVAANPTREALTGEEWERSNLDIRKFIDRFVPDHGGDVRENPIAQQLIALYVNTRWQRA